MQLHRCPTLPSLPYASAEGLLHPELPGQLSATAALPRAAAAAAAKLLLAPLAQQVLQVKVALGLPGWRQTPLDQCHWLGPLLLAPLAGATQGAAAARRLWAAKRLHQALALGNTRGQEAEVGAAHLLGASVRLWRRQPATAAGRPLPGLRHHALLPGRVPAVRQLLLGLPLPPHLTPCCQAKRAHPKLLPRELGPAELRAFQPFQP